MNSNNGQPARLRIGIVGCGRVAEYHARFIKASASAELVGIADLDQEAGRRFGERHGIPLVRATVDDLLDSAKLDVLHVVTPPAFHYACAKTALKRGLHVFVEKPIAFTAREVNELYDYAANRGLLLCPDFLQLFHPKVEKLSALIRTGQLGRVVHVETHWCLNPDDSPELLEAEGIHWTYRLPGGLLRDYTSHLLYMTLSFAGLPLDIHISRNCLGTVPQGLADHLTVQLEGTQSTATILLTRSSRPSAYGIRVLCEKGTAEVNFETQSLIVDRQNGLPRKIVSATANFIQSYRLSTQALGAITDYVRGKLVPYAGMQVLIQRFYDSILSAQPAPVSRELASAVTQVEEQIFSGSAQPSFHGLHSPSAQTEIGHTDRILVTGANGYVGYQIVKALVESGYHVRAFIRPTSSPQRLQRLGVEVFLGDVRRLEDLSAAAAGMQVIVHAAAGMKGSREFIVDTCVCGTRNVAEAASLQGLKRVLYISSFGVYDYAALRNGASISETSPLETQPERRGAYSLGKRQAEDIALSHLADTSAAWTILRPSAIVGNGGDLCAPLGVRIGDTLLCMSHRGKRLLLVHVEDVIAAVLQVLKHENTKGQVYTISHPGTITVREYVRACLHGDPYPGIKIVYIPYAVARLASWMALAAKQLTDRAPSINRRRLLSLYRDVGAESQLLYRHTGWRPAGDLLQRLSQETKEPVTAERVEVNQEVPAA